MHPDDAKDLAPHTQALQQAPVQVVDTNPLNVTKRLIAMEYLQLDDILMKRFLRVVESRLVDVRDKSEVRDILIRPTKIGGMGFDEARADRIIAELANVVEALHRQPKPKIQLPTPLPPSTQANHQTADTATSHPLSRPSDTLSRKGRGGQKNSSTSPSPRRCEGEDRKTPSPCRSANNQTSEPARCSHAPSGGAATVAQAIADTNGSAKTEARCPSPQPSPEGGRGNIGNPPRLKPVAPPTYREVVTDVRAPQRVMGPIEVLGSLHIDDFRRLGGTPQACTLKIGEEFEVLGQDSFVQRAEGISSFRQSPVFKAYLTLGQLAMERKEEVREVVELLKAKANSRSLRRSSMLSVHSCGNSVSNFMMQFVVPQFIDVEDKILGALSVRQFLMILIWGVTGFLMLKIFKNFLTFVLLFMV